MYLLMVFIVVLVLYFGVGILASRKLKVRKYKIADEKSAMLKGLKIVLLSDLHGRIIGEKQQELADRIMEQSPDLVVFAGDMIDAYDEDAEPASALAAKLAGKVNAIAVRGNHFYKADEKTKAEMEEAFDQYKVISLKNKKTILSYKDQSILIDGYDDPIAKEGQTEDSKKKQLEKNRKVMAQSIKETTAEEKGSFDYKIAVCHRPTEADLFQNAGYNLLLSGHTHGGQFALPFGIEPLGDEVSLFPPKNMQSGLSIHKKMSLVITSGIGYSNIKIRTFKPPEIVVIEFE
ncbi:MAG: metallophosphoesterase [Clostridia bacterium]|nr:metallophosphoesterase [Clostridia bacterium]